MGYWHLYVLHQQLSQHTFIIHTFGYEVTLTSSILYAPLKKANLGNN